MVGPSEMANRKNDLLSTFLMFQKEDNKWNKQLLATPTQQEVTLKNLNKFEISIIEINLIIRDEQDCA